MVRGVYYDAAEARALKTVILDGLKLTLTDGQRCTLEAVCRLAMEAGRAEVIPIFLSAETGTGKTEAALNAALLLLKRMSLYLRQLHAIYVAPTRKLATQVEARFQSLVMDHIPDVKMLAISGRDVNKKELVREIFSVFASGAGKTVLSTNAQFLASLATKSAAHYRLEPRKGQFQLAAALAEVNIIILDEPHFYVGKSLVRLLTLLMAILEYKTGAAIPHPTVLLFMSATMNPRELQNLLDYLAGQYEMWREINCRLPLSERWLHLLEPHRGAKWTVVEEVSDEAEVTQRVREVVQDGRFTVVYRDSVERLIGLQEALHRSGMPAVVVHSQMPESLQQRALSRLADGNVRAALVTSVAEIGIEFERYGIAAVDRMVSINTGGVGKLLQRWGRLARQPHMTGVLYAMDTVGNRCGVWRALSNPFDELEGGRTDYPSLTDASRTFVGEFHTAYCSPAADQLFAEATRNAIRKLTGDVADIYLALSERVVGPDNKDSFSVPLAKLSAGAMQLNMQNWAEFQRLDEGFTYHLRTGRLSSGPRPLLIGACRGLKTCAQLRHADLPDWLRARGVSGATLLQGLISLAMPIVNHGYRFESWVIQLRFPAGQPVGPGFPFTELYADLIEGFAPASVDIDLLARREQGGDMVLIYEPSLNGDCAAPVGGVEFIWRQVLGAPWP
jgi:superfamily II DNA or RNA helicase